jgi:hypothetical protein
MMTSQRAQAPSNERIVRLLEEVLAELRDAKEREQQITRDLARLLAVK